jgi:hypothetical protein
MSTPQEGAGNRSREIAGPCRKWVPQESSPGKPEADGYVFVIAVDSRKADSGGLPPKMLHKCDMVLMGADKNVVFLKH